METLEEHMPSGIEGGGRSMPPVSDEAAQVTPQGIAAREGAAAAACLDSKIDGASKPIPVPGTEEFAAMCRSLDGRSLGYRFAKRAFDIAFSCAVIAVGLVPCALLSVAISADTKGSPIYSQERVGRLGRSFRIYKFRSMVADADDVEKYLDDAQFAEWRRERKVTDDPRITPLGRVLRSTSLDELPQFLNVLLGQMSVIGPRAITYDELSWYGEDAALLLSVPQGVTGAWQAGSRNDASFESGERQGIELSYARSAGFREDARVFLATFGAMFGKDRSGR